MEATIEPSVAILGTRGFPSYYGGFETLVRRLAPYLSARGWRVDVYGRSGSTLSTLRSLEGVQSVLTPGLDSASLSTLSYGLTSSLHAVKKRPDVALVMNVANGYWLPLLKLRRIPTVVNVDGIEWEREKWGRQARRVFRGGALATAYAADELIFDSRAIEQLWKEKFHRTGTFIPYGGDPGTEVIPFDGLTSRRYVLFVARFVPENSVREFFAACSKLSQEFDVVIVGSSGYGGEFDKIAEELTLNHHRIRWYGHIHDDAVLNALWHHAGVYFHGHTAGGTNPSLVQAMASGAPIIAVDTSFNQEVLSGRGCVIQPNKESIDEILLLMRDTARQERIAQAVRARAESAYSWSTVCADYEKLLRGVIGSRDRRLRK